MTTAISATRRQARELVDGTIEVKLHIDPAYRKQFHELFPEIDAPVALAPLAIDSQHMQRETITKHETKPYGHEASRLYAVGFFYAPPVLKHVGTDREYLDWLHNQACMAKGCQFEPHWQMDVFHGCEAAHVRRVESGSGTGIKPEFSAISLCPKHHREQHHNGESAIGGREYAEKALATQLRVWAGHALADKFNAESMGYVRPDELLKWCEERELTQYLPREYKP